MAASAALARLDEIARESWAPPEHVEHVRERLHHRLDLLDGKHEDVSEHIEGTQRLERELNQAARRALLEARDSGRIGDDARLSVESELDLDWLRTGE